MKQKFITWFTGLIAAEVAKLETSLKGERIALLDTQKALETRLFAYVLGSEKRFERIAQGLEERSQELLKDFEEKLIAEASVVVGEKNQLIAELHTKIASLEQTARKITHWKADSSTVEADHSLKVVK